MMNERDHGQTMTAFVNAHPELRYIFFGGKGGVGKTVMAGACAAWFAGRGKKTLLVSTNPVHSLSSLLDQNVFGKSCPVVGIPGLDAHEIDTADTIKRSKEDIKEKIKWFLKFADIPTRADDFVETAAMNPAFEESAMFENMVNLIFAQDYDVYVFDTAPTANARRLLGMSKVYSLWVNKMLNSRREAQQMRLSLSFRKKEEPDPLLDYLLSFQDRIEQARTVLTDNDRTAFFFVTLPEALPIAVIRRFIGWFRDFGIPVGGVIVNGIIDRSILDGSPGEFITNRIRMQAGYLEQIHESFSDVRAEVPLFERDVRGVGMLNRVSKALFVS